MPERAEKGSRGFCGGPSRPPSERDLAAKAAPVLGVSERQVRNWLQCENDAALRHVFAVMTIACGEEIFSIIEGRG